MQVELFFRKLNAQHMGFVGVLTCHQDLGAETHTRFCYTGHITNDAISLQILLSSGTAFVGDWCPQDLDNEPVSSMLSHPVWAGYQGTQQAFGGYLGLLRTQNLPHEPRGVYRYLVYSASFVSGDLFQHGAAVMARSVQAQVQDNQAIFSMTPEFFRREPFQGLALHQVLRVPVWSAGALCYSITHIIPLSAARKLDAYKLSVVQDRHDVQLDMWAKEQGFGVKDDEYLRFLKHHYQQRSPMFENSGFLMTQAQQTDADNISMDFMRRCRAS